MGTDYKQYMIIGLPSCGSDWLCPLLARHSGGRLRYFEKEYFNPITNWKHTGVLESVFGCEMVSCYRNITAPSWDSNAQRVYEQTWCKDDYNFDKELMSPFRVEHWAQRFAVALLHRSRENTFPPSRARVWSWYDAIYHSLLAHGHETCRDAKPPTLAERTRRAHDVCWRHLKEVAGRLDLPILDYDHLCQDPEPAIVDQLGRVQWIVALVDIEAAAREIIATRRYPHKPAISSSS